MERLNEDRRPLCGRETERTVRERTVRERESCLEPSEVHLPLLPQLGRLLGMVEAKHVGPAQQDHGAWRGRARVRERGRERQREREREVKAGQRQGEEFLLQEVTSPPPTLVELRRLGDLNPVDRTLGAPQWHQRDFSLVVLEHAVFALQVQAVQDCRGQQRAASTPASVCFFLPNKRRRLTDVLLRGGVVSAHVRPALLWTTQARV